jgi:cephalosporin hydroxylase
MKQPRSTGPLDATSERPTYDPSGGFLYRGHCAMQNRRFPEVFEAFFEEVRPSTVIEIGAARGGFTHFLSEMRARFGFRLSAYDVREHEELLAIVCAERIPFARLDVLATQGFERISAEIRSGGPGFT